MMVSLIFPGSFAAELQARFIEFMPFPNGDLEVFVGIESEWLEWLKENAMTWAKCC